MASSFQLGCTFLLFLFFQCTVLSLSTLTESSLTRGCAVVKEIFGCNFFLVGFCSLAGWLEQQNTHTLTCLLCGVCLCFYVCMLFICFLVSSLDDFRSGLSSAFFSSRSVCLPLSLSRVLLPSWRISSLMIDIKEVVVVVVGEKRWRLKECASLRMLRRR